MEQPKIDPKTGKPKPEMKDAISQTDRSDYQIIKAKMLKERQQRELQAQLEAQNLQLQQQSSAQKRTSFSTH